MTKTASWVLKSELRFVLFQSASLPSRVAVIRRVRPGCESEFQEALRECFQASFGHNGVLGATMMVLPSGSASPEFGLLSRATTVIRLCCCMKSKPTQTKETKRKAI
jgi:hypothetical protein